MFSTCFIHPDHNAQLEILCLYTKPFEIWIFVLTQFASYPYCQYLSLFCTLDAIWKLCSCYNKTPPICKFGQVHVLLWYVLNVSCLSFLPFFSSCFWHQCKLLHQDGRALGTSSSSWSVHMPNVVCCSSSQSSMEILLEGLESALHHQTQCTYPCPQSRFLILGDTRRLHYQIPLLGENRRPISLRRNLPETCGFHPLVGVVI